MHAITTIEGHQTPSREDIDYMDYLDDLYDTQPPFGLLLFKGDPIAFRLGRGEWLATTIFSNA